MSAAKNQPPFLEVRGLDLDTPTGRPLFRDFRLSLGAEQAAVIGRNGVGKSSLLQALIGQSQYPTKQVICRTSMILVQQNLSMAELPNLLHTLTTATEMDLSREFSALGLRSFDELVHATALSRGELRKLALLAAKAKKPGLLMLDEPTQDLDQRGIQWLCDVLSKWTTGLLVVSHHRALLAHCKHFFVLSESGCRYVPGTFSQLQAALEKENHAMQKSYIRKLHLLAEREAHNIRVSRRRQRKKNLGRLHEIARMPAKVHLNAKRGYAQVSQGKRAQVRQQRITAARHWAKATRRALTVNLPMKLLMPELPKEDGHAVIVLREISHTLGNKRLFTSITLSLCRERIAVTGPNGAGKTTLINLILGQQMPSAGVASSRAAKIGVIAQGARDWCLQDSLRAYLLTRSQATSPEAVARLLMAHKFPLALAERPLDSLSPGERVRAALICLLERSPTVEFLILDEPNGSLDLVGDHALRSALNAWPGGLLVASNDEEFLQAIGVTRYIALDGEGGHTMAGL